MALEKIADGTVKRLVRSVPGLEFTETQLDEVRTVIESALQDTMAEAAAAYREVTVMCCGAEADLAHKINLSCRICASWSPCEPPISGNMGG